MSHARTSSEIVKTPHSVSVKVLRLSRPSPSQQTPLPPSSSNVPFHIDPAAALSSHSPTLSDPSFILSPLVTLPSSFGTLHVGENFTCTLCVNNEITSTSQDTSNTPIIAGVRITAEIQTPSSVPPTPLDLTGGPNTADPTAAVTLSAGETLQRILRYHLREEGNHVLAVTVTYTETQMAVTGQVGGLRPSMSGRVRTFRKLYQFVAQSLMGIRTKIRTLPAEGGASSISGKKATSAYVLEAQLENHSDITVVLDDVEVIPRLGMESRGLNDWAISDKPKPLIAPGDVMQIAFVLREGSVSSVEWQEKMRNEAQGLCQLNVKWKGSMGEPGELMTAWLGGKRR